MSPMGSNDHTPGEPDGSDRALRDEFAQWVSQGPLPAPDLHSLYTVLQQEVGQERGARAWLRSRSTPIRRAIACAGLALLALAAALGWLRPDFGVYPLTRMALTLLVSVALIAGQLWLVLRPLQRPALPRWVSPALTLVALAGLLALYALPAAHLAHPASAQAPGLGALLTRALPCLGIGLALAGATYALLWALDRGGAGRALLAAVCGGVSANLILQLHCPVTAPAHLVLGHLGVVLLFAGGVALRTRAAAWRS